MSAVEQIIQVPDTNADNAQVSDTPSEDPKANDPAPEPTQELESTDQAEVEEQEDDTSDDLGLEDDFDDIDLAENVSESDTLIPVKINGKEERWTLDQLKQSAAGQGYINQRMQEVAKLEKTYKAQSQALAQQQAQVQAFVQNIQQTGMEPPAAPDQSDFQNDPIGYMERKMQYDEAKKAYDTKVQQVQQMQQQQAALREQQVKEFTQQQAKLLAERLPAIVDPKKGEAIKKGIVETSDYYGFTEQEIGSVTDHRYILAMYDAMRYRKLVEKRGKATSKTESLPNVTSGAKKRPNEGKTAARKKAEARFKKTGSVEDAINLILK
tara:strand:+ start:1778 stop:2749 length:972 start_codon:yes stop_codon:yes gene_type:complete